MIKVTRAFTRPNINTLWFYEVLDISAIDSYDRPDARIINDKIFSNDFLTCTYVMIWYSQEVYDASLADPAVAQYMSDRDDYCNAMGIIIGERTIEPVDTLDI